ncbi:hypothetical protein [Neptunomonas japonica]|uniref:hypothetical protein n=1 Tax=Neptunomonas japonica TaxID=417574 RepID=UPI00040E6D84|nr:hypothetical protein [Neptunomonas japonica]
MKTDDITGLIRCVNSSYFEKKALKKKQIFVWVNLTVGVIPTPRFAADVER